MPQTRKRAFSLSVIAALPLTLAGCHSKYIEATITNHSATPLSVVQVDYPSASFGTQSLQPGASFHYRFKLQGSGPVKITFSDSALTEHHQTGPVLNEGQEGTLQIIFPTADKAEFSTSVHP